MHRLPLLPRFAAVLHRIFLFFFYILLKLTVGMYSLIRFRPRYEIPPEVRKLRPPFLVLADHVNPMDMFINGMGLAHVIRWVAADATFRTHFMKFVMTFLAGAVAKSKNRSDMVTLSRLQLLAGIGCVIGVYQEGEQSWDGVNGPPMPGTDKLVRFLKLPVVYSHLEGGYLDHPRWSWTGKKTPVRVRFELMIRKDEIENLPLSEISSRIVRAGRYDDWAYQKRTGAVLRGRRLAEHVELVCFLCPGCFKVNTLRSAGDDFSCGSCGIGGAIGRSGGFIWTAEPPAWPSGRPFANIREWNLWQIEHYRGMLDGFSPGTAPPVEPGSVLFWEDREVVHLSRGFRDRRMTDLGVGTARFFGDRIEFESPRDHLVMPLTAITGFSVFKQSYTEFYHERMLYRFTFTERSVSGYKWLMLFRLVTGNGRS